LETVAADIRNWSKSSFAGILRVTVMTAMSSQLQKANSVSIRFPHCYFWD